MHHLLLNHGFLPLKCLYVFAIAHFLSLKYHSHFPEVRRGILNLVKMAKWQTISFVGASFVEKWLIDDAKIGFFSNSSPIFFFIQEYLNSYSIFTYLLPFTATPTSNTSSSSNEIIIRSTPNQTLSIAPTNSTKKQK